MKKSCGRIAYEGFCKQAGVDMGWPVLSSETQECWEAAAKAVLSDPSSTEDPPPDVDPDPGD